MRLVLKTSKPQSNVMVVGQRPPMTELGRWINNFFPLIDFRHRVTHVGVFVIEITKSLYDKTMRQLPEDQIQSMRGSLICSQKFAEITAGAQISPPVTSTQDRYANLSAREEVILKLLAEGKSNKEIACQLAISVKTVESHKSRLMIKLHASSLVHLVHYAFKHHLVQIQA
jgi:DNA-binding CsgD family transcriptional regulator